MKSPTSFQQPRIHACILSVFLILLAAVSVVSAQSPEPQLACPSCQDYDACTADSCDTATGTCRHDPISCDDGNPCTEDSCSSFGSPSVTGCHHSLLASETTCDDGNSCTDSDACDGSGHCGGQLRPAGSVCDDGNPCTGTDTCDGSGACSGTPLQQGAECDDRNACTRGERCVVGADGSIACQGPAPSCDDGNPCTIDSCDPITGDCVNLTRSCDDGNQCTDDACDGATGACTHAARAGSCNDRNICTVNEFCQDGNCLSGGVWDCGRGDQCGFGYCDPEVQACLNDDIASGCPPPPVPECGNRNVCRNGYCVFVQGSGPGPCSDGNPCTTEMCVRGVCTVQLILTGQPCDDGSPCTQGDICRQNMTCSGTPTCSDGDACTTELCDPETGACLGSEPGSCDDGNPCTTDNCNSTGGCYYTFNTDPCSDNDACTVNDRCSDGTCQGTSAVVCFDDGNSCTDDYCDPSTGRCIHPNNFIPCNDGNPCTIGDSCQNGSCHAGSPVVCNDSNPCTQDACDPGTGSCIYPLITGPCNDGSACTTGDACLNGICTGSPISCDDGNTCTSDGCNPTTGCTHSPVTGPCDDHNPCTTGDQCVGGVCRPSAPVSCIDGNSCTIDYCDRTTGTCVHQPGNPECDDADRCTADLCDPDNGACLGHPPLNCDDSNDCTLDACDPATGCTHTPICPQQAVDITLTFGSPLGKGSGTLSWRTTQESSLKGFDVVVVDQQGDAVRLNPVMIPCTECVTGLGASYLFIVPKHKSGHNVFVELIDGDGNTVGRFGPAVKQ